MIQIWAVSRPKRDVSTVKAIKIRRNYHSLHTKIKINTTVYVIFTFVLGGGSLLRRNSCNLGLFPKTG